MNDKYAEAMAAVIADVLKKALAVRDERIAAHEQRLCALERKPSLKDAGIWRHGSHYIPGDVVQFRGSPWICEKDHIASGSPDHASFRLWQKSVK